MEYASVLFVIKRDTQTDGLLDTDFVPQFSVVSCLAQAAVLAGLACLVRHPTNGLRCVM